MLSPVWQKHKITFPGFNFDAIKALLYIYIFTIFFLYIYLPILISPYLFLQPHSMPSLVKTVEVAVPYIPREYKKALPRVSFK